MKLKFFIFFCITLLLIPTTNAHQPLLNDDGIVITHRGFTEMMNAGNSAITELNSTIKGMNEIVDETKRTIAAIPGILTSAEFITNAGIRAVGFTFCVGGAKWIWDGSNHLIKSRTPLLTKKQRDLRSKTQRRIAQKKAKEEKTDLEDGILEQLKVDQEIESTAHRNRGLMKLVAGMFGLGVGCYAMFRTQSIVNVFGNK